MSSYAKAERGVIYVKTGKHFHRVSEDRAKEKMWSFLDSGHRDLADDLDRAMVAARRQRRMM